MKYLFHLPFFVLIGLLAGCGPKVGSPQNPSDIPASELVKIVDATGKPIMTANTPPIFMVTLNNQSDWHITALEITVTSKRSGVCRSYLGEPFAYVLDKSKYDTVAAINPKSAGYFHFQIGQMLSWEEKLKEGSKWEKEFVFETHEWSIIRAKGYKK